jgi:hypothetical protein
MIKGNNMSDRFDFEQQIVRCWSVVDELKDLDEGLFEEWLKFDKDSISHHILGIAECYDLKFHKLWYLFEDVYMNTIRENKMLNEECAALRQQLAEAEGKPSLFGVRTDVDEDGFAVIKANKKGKK